MSSAPAESEAVRKKTSSRNKKEKSVVRREVSKRNQELRSKQLLDINAHNAGVEELQFTVEKDGKIIDYGNVKIPSESDYDAFKSASFLRRSNEIKELLKTKQEDTFGLVLDGVELRFCDIDGYDPVFDMIKIKKKTYNNETKKDQYLKSHSTESCNAQCVISGIVQKDYDSLGFQCFDDYLDTRTKTVASVKRFDKIPYEEIICGVEGCIFRCVSPEDMRIHQKLHSSPLPFPCLKKGCHHSCNSRVELKLHMLQHCKHVFPCLDRGCSYISSIPIQDSGHREGNTGMMRNSQKRSLCHLCKKLVFYHSAHLRLHPEVKPKCLYPGCSAVIRSKGRYLNHCLLHKLNDDLKSMQQK